MNSVSEKTLIETNAPDADANGFRANHSPTQTAGLSVEMKTLEAVFQVRGISKIYRMGEVEVHARRDVDLDLYEAERRAETGSGRRP